MEYSGLITKYRTNRPLTEQERVHQLKQKQHLNVEPHYQLCVIKMNSTYLESVDKWFAWKGSVSQYAIAVIAILVGSLGWLALQWLLKAAGVLPSTEANSVLLGSGIAMSIIVSLIAWFAIWFLSKESFAYTHYPIRFNRRTRMVHAFRTDGTVLSVPWDQVFFTLGFMPPWGDWEVRGLTAVEIGYLWYKDDDLQNWCERSVFRKVKTSKNMLGRTVTAERYVSGKVELEQLEKGSRSIGIGA